MITDRVKHSFKFIIRIRYDNVNEVNSYRSTYIHSTHVQQVKTLQLPLASVVQILYITHIDSPNGYYIFILMHTIYPIRWNRGEKTEKKKILLRGERRSGHEKKKNLKAKKKKQREAKSRHRNWKKRKEIITTTKCARYQ